QFMTVTAAIPDGLRYVRSQPPAVVDGRRLIWTLGPLQPGQAHTVQAAYQAERAGTVTSVAAVETAEGLKEEKSSVTTVTQPQLKVSMTGPPAGVVGVPIDYKITVSNPGSGPLSKVQ